MILRVLVNADLDEAVAHLTVPEDLIEATVVESEQEQLKSGNHWQWRHRGCP